MTSEELATFVADTRNEIGSLKHRAKNQEDQQKTMLDLVSTVKELALSMKYLGEEQKAQGIRLAALESVPAKRWQQAVMYTITGIIGILLGVLFKNFI